MENPRINSKVFRLLQLVIGVSLVLGILGVTDPKASTANGAFVPPSLSKAAIILNIAVYIVVTIIFVLSLAHGSAIPRPERPLRIHIPIALLAIAIRLLYSALCIFVHNSTFSLFNGSIAANVLMAIVEEFFVVIITLALGFKLRRISVDLDGKIVNLDQGVSDNGGQWPGSKDGPSNTALEVFVSA